MITFEEQLQQTENDNSIIGKKSPKVQTLSDVANTGVYSANDWIELPETKATSGEIIREGLRASQYQLNKIPTELKATIGQAMMSPESVLKIIPFTSMPTMITEQAKVKIFGGTKEADFNDFTGKTRVKQIGKELVQAAYRELKEKDKQYAQRATPLTEEETDTWKYGIASGIGNYGPMLAIGYLTGGVGALSFAVAQEAGQKTEEKLDYYAQKTGDTELKGYTGKQASKDLALTSVYTAGMGIMEKYIGIGKQMKLFKMSGGEYLKNIALTTLSEGLTEGLEDLYASGIDLVGGYIDTSKLPERYMQAVKSAVIGGLLGGTAGIGTAMAHRSQAKLILRKQYEKTIPAKDIDKVVNAIYDSTADTLQKVVATELANSESLRNKHGELYNSLKREISNQIKASGAYADVDEVKLANYIESVAKLTADNALGEANKRGVLLQDVLDSTKIKFENGVLRLAEKPKVSKLPIKKAKSENVEQVERDIENIKPREKVDLSEIKEVGGDFVRISSKKIPVDYEIVEAKDLLTSNDELGNINKDYPQYLQNRDRSRKELVLQVNSIAENIEPERLGKNVVATEGAPIVMGDNIVAMGNGRAQAVKLAYVKGKAEEYKEYLKQQGFNIDGFDKPVLVRKMRGEYSENVMRKLIEDANIAGTSQFSVSEQAIGDAQKISRETISLYDAESELDTAINRKFLREAFNEIIPETERGRYLDDAGNITQEGIKRVKNATLAYVMPDKRVLSSILETEDEVIRKASQAIMEASPSIVSFENDIDTGNIDKSYSILDDIRTAFNLYSAAKKSGSNVRAYIKNLDMLNDYTPAQQQITNWFVETKNAGELRNRINNYIQNARVEGDTKQGNMFGEPLTKQELLNKVSGSDMEQKAFADSYNQIAYENAQLDAENPAYDGETININGQDKTVYNSEGQRIAKSKEALENFYKWFGDSKVVDEQGRPLVVYHGTNAEFDTFKKMKGKTYTFLSEIEVERQGFFFTENRDVAQNIGKNVMPVYLKSTNIFDLDNNYHSDFMKKFYKQLEDSQAEYLEYGASEPWEFFDGKTGKAFTKYLQESGYDGATFEETPYEDAETIKTNVVFNSNQIKSTQNRGTYSESENIYYQTAYHGSGESELVGGKFSLDYAGTGEGNAAHGYGVYATVNYDVADKKYREMVVNARYAEQSNRFNEDILQQEYDKQERKASSSKSQVEWDKLALLEDLLITHDDAIVYANYPKELQEWYSKNIRNTIINRNRKRGQVYELDIPENIDLLDEQKSIYKQRAKIKKAIVSAMKEVGLDKFTSVSSLSGLNGADVYDMITRKLDFNQKKTSELLYKYGIKGITYDGMEDGRSFVIFNPEDVKVIQKFYQINHLPKSKKEIIKGSFDALTKSIKITSDADFSTYQHEFAHFWLDNMFNYAHSDLASENYKKDFKAIEKWLKYDDTRQSYFTGQQHEQFARGYEKFLYKGEVANPIIGKAYNDYENFIREVYSSMTEIDTKAGYEKYKAVPAKVYEFFNNMVRGELPNYGAEVDPKAVVKKEVEDTKTVIAERNKVIAENKKNYDLPPVKTDNTSGYMSETAKPKNIKPIENIEDKSVLTAYAKTMGEDVEAGRANLAKDYATAIEFVNKNPELAGQIVRGEVEAPTGMLKNSIYMAYNELQKKLGNTKNRAESALNQALELRRYGQEIASQRLAYMSEINPEYWIGRILTSKASQLAKENRMSVDKLNTTIKEAIERGMAENKTPKEIAKELREELGVTELYQTEIAPTEDTKSPSYNYIYKYVNEQLGLGMKEADAMEILRRTDDMWANIENSKAETGNPSIEYFEKLKALEDFANTLAPSSNLRVFVSVISPGSLLLNIKSSLTNIISNLPTGLMRAAVRRIRLGQMTSLVSPEKIALNKHYVWEVFAKTGYNITDMTELTPESKYHGEEITYSQGKGALRALGRWYEKVVYKWSLGAGDIFYKNLAFNDYASLLATKLANGDAKVANDLFDDAIRIEPLTHYGKAIRRMARDEALIATYQNDTALSKSAMKLRDATDFGVGLSKFFIPFVKTPANVIDLGLKTGFGSFKAIVSEVHRDMKAGKILKPTKENIELCIENGLGFALGFALSSMFDDDDYMPAYSMASAKDKQLAKELNIPFNSVRIGDTWFNLDYLGPLAVPLVGILNARREKDIIEKIGAFGKSGLMQIAALPAFGEIDDLMQKIEQYQHKGVKESAEQFVDNLGETIYSRIVPSIVNDVAKVLDGYDRERKGNEIITQIPFARENAPLKYNVTSGRPEEINQWWGIFTGARVKTQVVNSVAREFERLNNTGNGVSLTPVTRSGLLSSLSDNKKQQVNKEFAKEYAKQVSALIKTYKYKNSNDEDKKDMIDKIRRKIVKELKQEYLQK